MKKAIGISAVLVLLLASAAMAVDMVITPQLIHLDYTDSKDVTVCVYKADGSPYANLALSITAQCQDLNGDEVCSPAEDGNAAAIFNAAVKTSPTDANGCGEVTLTTNNAQGGTFAYHVNSMTGAGAYVDEEAGLAYIPEFTTVGAALVLLGAGAMVLRKKRK